MKNWSVIRYLLVLAGSSWLLAGCQSGASKELPAEVRQQDQTGRPGRPRPDHPRHGGRGQRDRQSQQGLARQVRNVDQRLRQTFYVDKSLIKEILDSDTCTGIRFYLAKATPGNNNDYQLILVGTKRNPRAQMAKDSLLDLVTPAVTQQALLRQYVVGLSEDKCPNNCDTNSPYYTQ